MIQWYGYEGLEVLAVIDPFWSAVTVAVIALIGAWLDRRHAARMAQLELKNDEQHARGYGLLQSIDTRTMAIDEKVDKHGEWIARHEVEHSMGGY